MKPGFQPRLYIVVVIVREPLKWVTMSTLRRTGSAELLVRFLLFLVILCDCERYYKRMRSAELVEELPKKLEISRTS